MLYFRVLSMIIISTYVLLLRHMFIMHLCFLTYFHLYCSAQLIMSNMENWYRNKIIVIIIRLSLCLRCLEFQKRMWWRIWAGSCCTGRPTSPSPWVTGMYPWRAVSHMGVSVAPYESHGCICCFLLINMNHIGVFVACYWSIWVTQVYLLLIDPYESHRCICCLLIQMSHLDVSVACYWSIWVT